MKVFLTGGTGFLGSHVAEQLVADGHQVRALVRKTSNTRFLESLGDAVELVHASLETGEGLERAVEGVDAVVHCAGLVKARSPEEFHRVNAQGTVNLLEATKKVRPKLHRFVFISSLAAHGPSMDGKPRPVDAEKRPVTHYGRSKAAAEEAVVAQKDALPITVIRPPAIYGPRDNEMYAFFKTVKRRLAPLIGGGENTLSIIYGPDCAAAVYQALTTDHPSGRIYFVEDGRRYTWKEMGEALQEALGVKALEVKLPVGVFSFAAFWSEMFGKMSGKAVMLTRDKVNELKAPHWVCDSTPIRQELGWQPTVTWEEGARLTAEWYRREGWL